MAIDFTKYSAYSQSEELYNTCSAPSHSLYADSNSPLKKKRKKRKQRQKSNSFLQTKRQFWEGTMYSRIVPFSKVRDTFTMYEYHRPCIVENLIIAHNSSEWQDGQWRKSVALVSAALVSVALCSWWTGNKQAYTTALRKWDHKVNHKIMRRWGLRRMRKPKSYFCSLSHNRRNKSRPSCL